MKIKISKDFAKMPGGRYQNKSDKSGEEFRKDLLIPKYNLAKSSKEKLIIDLDGLFAYPSSFFEEAFGGLVREFRSEKEQLISTIDFVCEENPIQIDRIKRYMNDADK